MKNNYEVLIILFRELITKYDNGSFSKIVIVIDRKLHIIIHQQTGFKRDARKEISSN